MAYRKDWDAIARDLSSPESSDAEDELNVMSVRKNASRVAELVHGLVPGLDATQMRTAPVGMNRPDLMRDALAKTIAGTSRHSGARPPAPTACAGGAPGAAAAGAAAPADGDATPSPPAAPPAAPPEDGASRAATTGPEKAERQEAEREQAEREQAAAQVARAAVERALAMEGS